MQHFKTLIIIESNLDNLIIHKVCLYVKWLLQQFPHLQYLYIAIDGVPLYAKIIEQRKRRVIGNLIGQSRDLLLEHFKSELDIQTTNKTSRNDIYYNHYKFEHFIIHVDTILKINKKHCFRYILQYLFLQAYTIPGRQYFRCL